MAGSLIKIDEEIVSGTPSTVQLLGIDSTYDVYMVRTNNVQPTTDASVLGQRVTVSGTADSTANYDEAFKFLRTDTTFSNISRTNQNNFLLSTNLGTATQEVSNAIYYLFNFNNASEYSFMTAETSERNQSAGLFVGVQGGGVHTVAQSCDGIEFFFTNSSTFSSGQFVLYGLKK
jgi:hypothetical protein